LGNDRTYFSPKKPGLFYFFFTEFFGAEDLISRFDFVRVKEVQKVNLI
jgi:hypothetical protein